MANEMQDHCHIGESNPPTEEYRVYASGYDVAPELMLATDRALDGTLHVHCLLDDDGNPKQLVSHKLRLKLTLEEKATVEALYGKSLYYIPNYHDEEANTPVYRCTIVPLPGNTVAINPQGEYWSVGIQVLDDTI